MNSPIPTPPKEPLNPLKAIIKFLITVFLFVLKPLVRVFGFILEWTAKLAPFVIVGGYASALWMIDSAFSTQDENIKNSQISGPFITLRLTTMTTAQRQTQSLTLQEIAGRVQIDRGALIKAQFIYTGKAIAHEIGNILKTPVSYPYNEFNKRLYNIYLHVQYMPAKAIMQIYKGNWYTEIDLSDDWKSIDNNIKPISPYTAYREWVYICSTAYYSSDILDECYNYQEILKSEQSEYQKIYYQNLVETKTEKELDKIIHERIDAPTDILIDYCHLHFMIGKEKNYEGAIQKEAECREYIYAEKLKQIEKCKNPDPQKYMRCLFGKLKERVIKSFEYDDKSSRKPSEKKPENTDAPMAELLARKNEQQKEKEKQKKEKCEIQAKAIYEITKERLDREYGKINLDMMDFYKKEYNECFSKGKIVDLQKLREAYNAPFPSLVPDQTWGPNEDYCIEEKYKKYGEVSPHERFSVEEEFKVCEEKLKQVMDQWKSDHPPK